MDHRFWNTSLHGGINMNLDVLLAIQNKDFHKAFEACLKASRKQKRWSQN